MRVKYQAQNVGQAILPAAAIPGGLFGLQTRSQYHGIRQLAALKFYLLTRAIDTATPTPAS
jgi:hypothetical protein